MRRGGRSGRNPGRPRGTPPTVSKSFTPSRKWSSNIWRSTRAPTWSGGPFSGVHLLDRPVSEQGDQVLLVALRSVALAGGRRAPADDVDRLVRGDAPGVSRAGDLDVVGVHPLPGGRRVRRDCRPSRR